MINPLIVKIVSRLVKINVIITCSLSYSSGHEIPLQLDWLHQVILSTDTDLINWIWAFGARGLGVAEDSLTHHLITHPKPRLDFSHPPDQEVTDCETCCKHMSGLVQLSPSNLLQLGSLKNLPSSIRAVKWPALCLTRPLCDQGY